MLAPVTVLLTVLYFVPDMAGSSLYVADLAGMSGRSLPIIAAARAGFALSLAGAYGIVRFVRPDLSRMFGLPQLLLALAVIKLLAGGVRGFEELSLIPPVQAGLAKLVHDIVHQGFVFALVPDHLILSTTTWNFIGILFSEGAGRWLSLVLLALPMALFIWKHFAAPVTKSQMTCDLFLSSSNAVTMNGELVNIDGAGNRVNSITFGPRKVILVTGYNKLVGDVAEAITRIKNVVTPMNAKRLKLDVPCVKTGKCVDCNSSHRLCRATVILERRPSFTEMLVILVGEELGY